MRSVAPSTRLLAGAPLAWAKRFLLSDKAAAAPVSCAGKSRRLLPSEGLCWDIIDLLLRTVIHRHLLIAERNG